MKKFRCIAGVGACAIALAMPAAVFADTSSGPSSTSSAPLTIPAPSNVFPFTGLTPLAADNTAAAGCETAFGINCYVEWQQARGTTTYKTTFTSGPPVTGERTCDEATCTLEEVAYPDDLDRAVIGWVLNGPSVSIIGVGMHL
ncbi:MAG TPA: hypothetical protein VGC05_05135 [Mycobacterium sp.]